jgi:hypothetical protein
MFPLCCRLILTLLEACGSQVGRSYPKTQIFRPSTFTKEKMHLSREFSNAPMPYSLRIFPQKGIFIHQWDNLSASHGCIHVLPGDAKKVFDFVKGPTKIDINYPKEWDSYKPWAPEVGRNPLTKTDDEYINIDDDECSRVAMYNGKRYCIGKG